MIKTQRLMCIFAHPDDETLGVGGIIARYAAQGTEVFLLTATRGQRGWPWEDKPYPGAETLGRQRETELRAAARELGIREVTLLDYMDGELAEADPLEVTRQAAAHIRRLRPQVVLTFDPHGVYGHPDHIAICQITTAAVMLAGTPDEHLPGEPHSVSKLYYLAETQASIDEYQALFGEIVMPVDGEERRGKSWEDWAITTRVDCRAYWQHVWRAAACHQTQLPGIQGLLDLPEAQKQSLWATQSLYRIFSLVDPGEGRETDLFAGIGQPEQVA